MVALADSEVLAFGLRHLRTVLGDDFPGRVFLAGGAFKTLVHGRPPRDLDLWAPTPADRRVLIDHLQARGRPLGRRAFADGFRVGGQEVEVPDKAEPPTLEGRLARFDLGIVAIGVECGGGPARAVVHPLARVSVERREILLLKPLANPRHCLSTLARARRAAAELGFRVPPQEEAAVWEVFDAADPPSQRELLAESENAAVPDWGVLAEARARAGVRPRSG